MANNERSSPALARLASAVLKGRKPTLAEAKRLAGSVLTQAPDKRKEK